MKHTSLKLSKLLWKKGLRGESELYWQVDRGEAEIGEYINHEVWEKGEPTCYCVRAYDLFWDIFAKHGEELFGEMSHGKSLDILELLIKGKNEEAEKEIIKHLII